MSAFDLELFCACIQKYRVTKLSLVPPIVLALAKSPVVDKYDLSSVRFATSGAAPLGERNHPILYCHVISEYDKGLSVLEQSEKRLPNMRVGEGNSFQ